MPGTAGDILAVGAFMVIILHFSITRDSLASQRLTIVLLFTIYAILLLNAIRFAISGRSSSNQIVRAASVILVNIACLFVIPTLYDFESSVFVINRIAFLAIIVGIPSVFIGSHEFFWVTIDPYTSFSLFPGIDATLPALRSIYPDTNAAGKIAMFGLFLSLYEYRRRREWVTSVLFGTAVLGVYLTHSRGVLLAVFCGFVVLLLGMHGNRAITSLAVIILILSSFVGFLFLSGVLPAGAVLEGVNLSLRGHAWRAAFSAFADYPLFGMGFGESATMLAPYYEGGLVLSAQNSYLKLFVAGGVIAGMAYLVFIVTSVLRGIFAEAKGMIPIELLSLCIALMVVQIFENFSLFGVNQSSVIASIMFGYLVHMRVNENESHAEFRQERRIPYSEH